MHRPSTAVKTPRVCSDEKSDRKLNDFFKSIVAVLAKRWEPDDLGCVGPESRMLWHLAYSF